MRFADVDDALRRLEEFRALRGHLYVPATWVCDDGFRLGKWVAARREAHRHGRMHQRYEVLHCVPGWDWQTRHYGLIEGLQQLRAYVEAYGTAEVPYGYVCEDGFRLSIWVRNRRRLVGKQPWLDELLSEMPGWRWRPRVKVKRSKERGPSKTERGLAHIWEFVGEEGHARPPHSYVSSDGFALGKWVSWRRKARGKDPKIDVLLGSLPGWSWNAHESAFDRRLIEFEAAWRAGTVEADRSLCRWALRQRAAAAEGRLPTAKRERLAKASVLRFAPALRSKRKHVHGEGSTSLTWAASGSAVADMQRNLDALEVRHG